MSFFSLACPRIYPFDLGGWRAVFVCTALDSQFFSLRAPRVVLSKSTPYIAAKATIDLVLLCWEKPAFSLLEAWRFFSLPSEFRHFRRAGVKWRIASGGAFWYSRLVHPSGQKKIIPYLVWWLAICLCSLLEFPVSGYFHPLSILCMFHSPLLQISSVLRENSLTWPSESLTMSFSQFTAPNGSVHLLCVFLILRIACCSWISYFSEQLVFMDAVFTHISS